MKSNKIRQARKSAGITQDELAEKLHVNRATISKYENGMIEPSITQLKAIAAALDVQWYELCSDLPKEQAEEITRYYVDKLKDSAGSWEKISDLVSIKLGILTPSFKSDLSDCLLL